MTSEKKLTDQEWVFKALKWWIIASVSAGILIGAVVLWNMNGTSSYHGPPCQDPDVISGLIIDPSCP